MDNVTESPPAGQDTIQNTPPAENVKDTFTGTEGGLSDFVPVELISPQDSGTIDSPVRPESGRKPRKLATEAEKLAARERRKSKKDLTDKILLSRATAETITGGLDTIRSLISAGQVTQNSQLRAATVDAWARYCHETGKDIPPVAMVIILSCAYTAPALGTDNGRGFISGLGKKLRSAYRSVLGRVNG